MSGGLKPCPWCGTKPWIDEERGCFSVWCAETKCPIAAGTQYKATREEAIAAWNGRTDPTKEAVDELRAKMRMIVSHATGGSFSDIDASVNDICVRITANRNHIYQAGKDAALAESSK